MPTIIDICHQPPGQDDEWNAISVTESGLNGHKNHASDVWPPVPGVTEGMNWDADGYGIWANGCTLTSQPSPLPTETAPVVSEPPTSPTEPIPMPTASLPMPSFPATGSTQAPVAPAPYEPLARTGIEDSALLLALLLTVLGVGLVGLGRHKA